MPIFFNYIKEAYKIIKNIVNLVTKYKNGVQKISTSWVYASPILRAAQHYMISSFDFETLVSKVRKSFAILCLFLINIIDLVMDFLRLKVLLSVVQIAYLLVNH